MNSGGRVQIYYDSDAIWGTCEIFPMGKCFLCCIKWKCEYWVLRSLSKTEEIFLKQPNL